MRVSNLFRLFLVLFASIFIPSIISNKVSAQTSSMSAFLEEYSDNKNLHNTSMFVVKKGDTVWNFAKNLITPNNLELSNRNINLMKNLLIILNQIPSGTKGQHYIETGKTLILIRTNVVAEIIKLYEEIKPSENFWRSYIEKGNNFMARLDETRKVYSPSDPGAKQINIPGGSYIQNSILANFSGGYDFSLRYRKVKGFTETMWETSGYDIIQKKNL